MSTWLEVDVEGLRKTLVRKGKAWALFELIQNSWDANSTEVKVTLTQPKNGLSKLVCVDNSPEGFADLSHAHTLYAESDKKGDATKRGRFSAGDKYVLALCRSASVTSTTGRVTFMANGTRKRDDNATEVGTQFRAELVLTQEDYDDIMMKVVKLIPAIPTYINGGQIPSRTPIHTFNATLPTELADDAGILRQRRREAAVHLYDVLPGEQATLFEMGLPVVPIDNKWHVSIEQKVPLNLERDNVNPSYLRAVYSAVLNERSGFLTDEDAHKAWVTTALTDKKTSVEATKNVVVKRFGEGAVKYSRKDRGSNREAASKNVTVVPPAALPPEAWAKVNEAEALPSAEKVYPTNFVGEKVPAIVYSREMWTPEMIAYEEFLVRMAPLLIDRTVTVEYIEDDDLNFQGCTRWTRGSFVMEINLAFHHVNDWQNNIYLMIHEFAHHAVQSNDHLHHKFYRTVNNIAARLVKLAQAQPELFPNFASAPDTSSEIESLMNRRFRGVMEAKEPEEVTADDGVAA
jgi:hypothetical protein